MNKNETGQRNVEKKSDGKHFLEENNFRVEFHKTAYTLFIHPSEFDAENQHKHSSVHFC